MLTSHPCLTVTCYYPYFLCCVFLVSRVKILFGFIQKTFWEWKVFVTKLKWNTLTWIIYSSVMWGLIFTVQNKEIIQPQIYCACVRVCVCVCEWVSERNTQSAFPLNEILWLRLIRSGYATCSELNYVVPGDVTLETTPIPGTCYTYWHGQLMISDFLSDMVKSYFVSIYPIFQFFLQLYKKVFENVSRNLSTNKYHTSAINTTFILYYYYYYYY